MTPEPIEPFDADTLPASSATASGAPGPARNGAADPIDGDPWADERGPSDAGDSGMASSSAANDPADDDESNWPDDEGEAATAAAPDPRSPRAGEPAASPADPKPIALHLPQPGQPQGDRPAPDRAIPDRPEAAPTPARSQPEVPPAASAAPEPAAPEAANDTDDPGDRDVAAASPALEPVTPEPIAPEPAAPEPVASESAATDGDDPEAPENTFDPETASPAELEAYKRRLQGAIARLEAQRADRLDAQLRHTQGAIGRMLDAGLSELEQRRQVLQAEIEQLERRRERIRKEMRTTFAGASQTLAVRVQGFKEYLVGSLQDLVAAAEDLQLVKDAPPAPAAPAPAPSDRPPGDRPPEGGVAPQFAQDGFQEETRKIRKLLDRYRNRPDYYGPPWRLRRTFEPVHAERVSAWFFERGGRGALRTLGSRLQNVLVASAAISTLRALYGDRVRVLVSVDSPEQLGEWRRGLQDCLGISRADFGPDRGVVLFEDPEPLAQKADRLMRQGDLPFIIIDESDGRIAISLLQFPLWLAFAPDPSLPAYPAGGRDWV